MTYFFLRIINFETSHFKCSIYAKNILPFSVCATLIHSRPCTLRKKQRPASFFVGKMNTFKWEGAICENALILTHQSKGPKLQCHFKLSSCILSKTALQTSYTQKCLAYSVNQNFTFDFTTTDEFDCMVAVESLLALHYSENVLVENNRGLLMRSKWWKLASLGQKYCTLHSLSYLVYSFIHKMINVLRTYLTLLKLVSWRQNASLSFTIV